MTKKEKIESWQKHYSNSKEKEFYSIQRIDILIISISGACIYIIFEILKFLNSPDSLKSEANTTLLKISASSSVIAICINFLSQILGYKANHFESIYSRKVINQIEDDYENEAELESIDKKSKFYNKLTSLSNIVSTIFMIIGILILTIFNLITF